MRYDTVFRQRRGHRLKKFCKTWAFAFVKASQTLLYRFSPLRGGGKGRTKKRGRERKRERNSYTRWSPETARDAKKKWPRSSFQHSKRRGAHIARCVTRRRDPARVPTIVRASERSCQNAAGRKIDREMKCGYDMK